MKKTNNNRSGVRKAGRLFCLLLALTLLLSAAGCGSSEKKKYKVVATVFPLYDWARQVIGEDGDTELILLEDSGVDLHSYQASAADMANISNCDLFIYVGGESDEWVEDALKNAANPKRQTLNLLEALGDEALDEEHKEGMQEDGSHHEEEPKEGDHDHESEGHEHASEGHEHEEEKDEHIWLSLKKAVLCTELIRDAIKKIDPSRAEKLDANTAAYTARLDALWQEYEAAAAGAVSKTLLFGDRFPFRYMTQELGLDYFAAFSGCSAETEASFETVIFLAKKLDELGLKTVLQTEGGDPRLAQTIIDSTASKNQRILQMDSLQSVTAQRVKEGATYLGIMEKNLEVLKEALK